MRKASAGIMLAALVIAGTATPARSGEFLKHLDTLMRNYSESFYKEGSPGDIAEKWFRGGPKVWFSLKEMDTTMKSYADAQQKVGEQALADLKVVAKDLISFKTYLPNGLVQSLGAMKARFLARCANPWADDGAGAGAGMEMASTELSGGDVGDGGLPAASMTRASGTRVPGGKAEGKDGMTDSFVSYVNFRKSAQAACKEAGSVDASKKKEITDHVLSHARRMETVLVAKLLKNDTALTALDEFCATLPAGTARGCFGTALTRLVKEANAAAMASGADPKAKTIAKHAAALKKKIAG